MTDVLTPNAKQQFFTNNGAPAAQYRLFTYAAGTSTKLATHTSSSGAVNNSNPITLDFRGECNVWIPPNTAYKFVFAPPGSDDPPTAPIWTVDNIVSSQLITLYGGLDTGSANNYVVTFAANFTSYTDGITIYWLAANTNTIASTLNVNGLGAVPVLNADGSTLSGGAITANTIVGVIYRGGNFYLLYPAVVTGSFTATLTGMTTTVTGTVNYRIVNGICSLYINANIVGTSNSTAMTMTGLPVNVLPIGIVQRDVACLVRDNGANFRGAATVTNVGSVITFSMLNTSGANIVENTAGFTAAGSKGLNLGWQITYPL